MRSKLSMRPDSSTESVTFHLTVPNLAIATRPVGPDESTPTSVAGVGSSARTALTFVASILSRKSASKWEPISRPDSGAAASELKNHLS